MPDQRSSTCINSVPGSSYRHNWPGVPLLGQQIRKVEISVRKTIRCIGTGLFFLLFLLSNTDFLLRYLILYMGFAVKGTANFGSTVHPPHLCGRICIDHAVLIAVDF